MRLARAPASLVQAPPGVGPAGVAGQRRARSAERAGHPVWRSQGWGGARGQSAGGAAVPDPLWGPAGAGGGTNCKCVSNYLRLGFSWPGAGEGEGKALGGGALSLL